MVILWHGVFPSIIPTFHLFRGNPISGGGQTRDADTDKCHTGHQCHTEQGRWKSRALEGALWSMGHRDAAAVAFWGHFAVRSLSSYRVLEAMATCWLPHFSLPLCCDNKWMCDRWAAVCRFTFKMPPNLQPLQRTGPRVWSLYLAIKRESRPKSRLPRFPSFEFVSYTEKQGYL